MTITSVDSYGNIEGKASFSPSDKADKKYGLYGSYYFNGELDIDTNDIYIDGYEWIRFPGTEGDGFNYHFPELWGTIDFNNNSINGKSSNGIWTISATDADSIISEFELGTDNNSYPHYIPTNPISGFYKVKNYSLDETYKQYMINAIVDKGLNVTEEKLNEVLNRKWESACTGVAATIALIYNGDLKLTDISNDVDNYYSMKYPNKNKKLLNVINMYQIAIDYFEIGKQDIAKLQSMGAYIDSNADLTGAKYKKAKKEFLKKVVECAQSDDIYCLSSSAAKHTILVIDANYNKSNSEYIIRLYDENSVDKNTPKGFFTEMIVSDDFSSYDIEKGYDYEKDFEHHFLSNDALSLWKPINILVEGEKHSLIKEIKTSKITLSKTSYTYTGKAKKPAVTVKYDKTTLKKGTDYTVSYKNNKAVGKATVTIKGKGGYTGTVTKTFKINPKKTTVKKLTSPKTKQLKVTYKKVSGATGYQVTYSTSKKSTKATTKTVTVKGAGKLSKTVKSLKKGKTYYVKVRSYKTVSGKKYYSSYTAAKKIKVK
ncbi:MAG: hypothetical protein IJ740_16675 [Ruminococcus sp.]|nr:hypothetical protein [Ruminococcus sp.]